MIPAATHSLLLVASLLGTASAYPAWYVVDGPAVHYKQYHRILTGTFNTGGTGSVNQNCNGAYLVPTASGTACQAAAGWYLSGNSASTTAGTATPLTCAGATTYICPQGTYGTANTAAGLANEVLCGANMIANPTATACVAAFGFFTATSDTTGSVAGTPCPAGFTTPSSGSTASTACTTKCDLATPTGCNGDYTFTSAGATSGCYYGNVASLVTNGWTTSSVCTDCPAGFVSAGWSSTASNSTCFNSTLITASALCTGTGNAVTATFTGGESQSNAAPTSDDLTDASLEVLGNPMYAGGFPAAGCYGSAYTTTGLAATCGSTTCTQTGNGAFTCTGFTADVGYECAAASQAPVGSLTTSTSAFTCSAVSGTVQAAFSGGNYAVGNQPSSPDIAIINAFNEPLGISNAASFGAAASGTAANTCVVSAANVVTCYGYPVAAGYNCSAAGAFPTATVAKVANPVAYVQSAVALIGMTVAQFNTTAVITSFQTSVAFTAGVSASDVAITAITAYTPSGRHLLQTGVNVAFTVASSSAANTAALTTSLAAISGSATFLNTLQSSNPAFNSVSSVSVTQAPTAAVVSSALGLASTGVFAALLVVAASL